MKPPLIAFRPPSPPRPDFPPTSVPAPTRAASPPPALTRVASQASLSSHGSGEPARLQLGGPTLSNAVWISTCATTLAVAWFPAQVGLGVLGLWAVMAVAMGTLAACRRAGEVRAARELLDPPRR